MSKEVGLTTDGTFKELTSWDEGDEYLSSNISITVITDITTGTKYYLDPIQEKYIEITGDFETFTTSTLLNLPFFTGATAVSYFARNVVDFMANKVLSYGYSSIEDAISYYNSGVTAWRNEAIAFNTWRDNTETLMYDNIFSYTADGITLPDLAGFTAQAGYFDVGIASPSRPNLFS